MRISGGVDRGKRVAIPKNFRDRPTTDFAKEALLNIILNSYNIESLSLLDLFAGTGAISFEFASRGCSDILAVEINNNYCKAIRKNAVQLNYKGLKVVRDDALHFIKICKKRFDIIFADPPYDFKAISDLPDLIFGREDTEERGKSVQERDEAKDRGLLQEPGNLNYRDLLQDGGIFILEHSRGHNFEDHPNFNKKVRYGAVNFTFFNK